MAIQNRRGNYADFVPSKMLPGEFAVSQDNRKLFLCFVTGVVKEIALQENVTDALANLDAALSGRIVQLETSDSSNTASILALATRMGNAETALTTHSGQLLLVEQKGNELSARLASVEETLQLAQDNIALNAQHISEIQQDVRDIFADLLTKTGQIYNLDGLVGRNTQNLSTISTELTELKTANTNILAALNGKVDEAILSEDRKYLILKADGSVVAELGPFAGEGGGGGGGGGAVVTEMHLYNDSGWLAKTVSSGTELSIDCHWSSTLDEIPTGSGMLKLYVDGTVRRTRSVEQGNFSVNISDYLAAAGTRSFRINVTDAYGKTGDLRYTVIVEDYELSSSFSYLTPVTGAFNFLYTPKGDAEKVVHFKVDNTELTTETVTTSGWQQTKVIPAQSHGAHTLDVWFEVDMDGDTVESNHLKYEFMSVASGNTTPIITSQTEIETAEQYQTIAIKYQVYDPAGLTTDISLLVDGTAVQTLNIDRTEHTWSYRPMDFGSTVLKIRCGSVEKSFPITVAKSSANIYAVTEDLALYLTAQGRSNAEEHPEVWQYELISCTLSDFNFVSDGWQLDDANVPVLRVSGDARVTIPYKIFAQDFRSTGKTIELEFSTTDVMNYDTPIISCVSGGRGIVVTSQAVTFTSEQSSITTQFKEDEHVRVSFVVEKRSKNRLIYCYVNGDMCYVLPYPDDDDFSQIMPVNISIGSNDATVNIYCIRVYDNDLDRHQIFGNRIADTANVTEMLAMYERNDIFDGSGKIVISKLPANLPYMIITVAQLPQYKGDKKTCSITYVDPAHPEKSFTAENVQIDVQGTSSQYYPRKNYKIKYRSGFINNVGETSSKYQLKDDVLPANVFCMKADFASSDECNNVEICEISEQINPYKTPAQVEDELVRQTVAGLPCVIFWNDGTATDFIGLYNFNTDKSAENTFGFVSGDESWEVKTHASNRVLWKVSDFTGDGWLDDFEARYPDTDPAYTDSTQLKAFADWIVQTDTDAATGDALAQSVTYDGVTYTTDTAAYRLAKFKAEVGNYVEMDSMLFYYLITDFFLMVDSRSKNMFPSFMGSEVVNQ